MAKDAISALRDILATNWSKPPEPSIEDIADVDKGDAKRVRMLDNDVIRIFETAHNEAQPELIYDYVNEHVNITIDCRTVDSRERLSEIRDEVRRIIHAFRKGDNNNFDRLIYKTRTDLSDRSKKLFRYTIQCEVITFSLLATAVDPVVNPADGQVSGGNTFQTFDGDLLTIAQMTPSDGVFIVGSGSNWVAESGATARTSLGLGSMATQNSDAVSITGGSIGGVSGVVYSVAAGTGLTGTATSGAITLNVADLTVSELAAGSLQISSESFADNDTSLMTSAAIQDKILSYGYAVLADITSGVDLTAGTGMLIQSETNTGSGDYSATITLDLKDEDDFVSNSAVHAASQQSVKAYVDTRVSNLLGGAPAALDTLNELAASINDDANFTGTMTTALGNRVRVDTNSQGLTATEQSNARANIGLNAGSVPSAGTGIDISGSGEFSVDVSDFMGSGANNRVLTATGTDAFQGESTLTYDGTTLTIDNGADEVIALGSGSGLATIEIGGDSGARIDLKSPNSDDFDIRLHTTGSGGELVTASPLTLKTSGNNDDITFAPHGTGKVKFGASGFTLPTSDGTANQTLKTDGSGALTFQDDLNHTYAISSATVTGGANIVLTAGGSGSGTDTVKITGGTNTTVTQNNDEITLVSADTTYSVSTSASGGDARINLTAGGSGSGTDFVTLAAGTNVTIEETGDTITFSAASAITYDLLVAQTSGDNDNPALRLDPSSGSNDDITIVGGTNVTVTRDSNTQLTITATDTNTQLSTEQVQDIVGAMVDGGTETNIAVTYDDTGGKLNFVSTDTNTQLTQEQVEDFVAGVITAGSNITKTYDDAAGTLTLAATDTNTQLSTEQVQDIVGAMVSANTETNISVTYDDTGGKLNFVSTDTNTQLTLLDEDNFSSNSATAAASQQSIKAYVDSKTASIVDSAPAALDTLNELAAALNDDASFSTTTATSLGNRLRIDDNQSLTSTQQAQGLTNLGFTATLAEINILDDGLSASDIPSLATSKITSGTFDDGRIAQSNVTQHLAVGSGGGIGLSGKTFTLDIDGMTDIGAALVDADLFIVDDGADGTNRKATMGRLKTYMQNNLTFTSDTNTNQLTTFTLTADSGSNQTIAHGNTLDIAGSSPIVTSVGATDTVTVALDDPVNLSELTESTDATDDKILLWDESASSWKYMTIDNLQDSIDTASGGGAVSAVANGANNRIATFSSADALNGESTLTYDGSLTNTELKTTGTGSPILSVKTTATSGQQANIILHGARNSENTVGQITFSNNDTSGSNTGTYNAARILAFNDGGDLAGGLKFQTTPSGSSTTLATRMTITESGNVGIGTTSPVGLLDVQGTADGSGGYKKHLLIQDTGTAFDAANNGGALLFGGLQDASNHAYWAKISGEKANTTEDDRSGTLQFWTRKEGGSPTQRMTIDEDGNVGIGTTSPSVPLHVVSSGTTSLLLESTDAGAADAPILELYRNSASPANTDDLGQILWSGEKSDGSKYGITKMYGQINTVDNSDRLMINVASSGGSGLNDYEYIRLDGGVRDIIFNETGQDIDVRMEGSSVSGLFFLDASTDRIGIGTTSPQSLLHVSSGTSGDAVLILEADTDNNAETDQPFIVFEQDGGTQHSAIGSHSGSNTDNNALILSNSVSSSGIEAGMIFKTGTTSGYANAVERMRITPAGDITMTEDLDVAKHFSFDTQHVGGSAGGSTGTENGANTWCKILSWDPGTGQYKDLSLTLGITAVDVGSQNQAIINVYGRSNATNGAHTIGVKVISLISTVHLQDDSFKMITEGWGQPIELWMKKYGNYGTYNWNEIAKKQASSTTLTYSSNSAWQSTEPVKTNGSPQATRSYGTVIETRNPVLNLYHNQNVSGLSAGDVLSTISFRKHTTTGGNETIRIYNVQGDSGNSGASDDYHTSDLRISTRKIGTNAYTDRFTILGQEGYVGIGTMSPAVPLHVESGNNEAARFLGSGNDAFIKIQEPTGSENVVLGSTGGTGFVGSASNNNFAIRANNSNKMFVTSAGKVGIGTSSPTGILTITNSGHDMIHLNRTVDNEGYGMGIIGRAGNDSSTTAAHEYAGIFLQIEDHTDGAEKGSIAFHTSTGGVAADQGSTHAMQITSDNKVGIGTASPVSALDLNTGALSFANTNTQLKLSGGSNVDLQLGHWGNTHILIDTDGNDSSRYFSVRHGNATAGSATELFKVTEAGETSVTGNLTVSGDLTINGTTTTIDTTNLAIEDNIIVLNKNVTGTPADVDAGIEVERGDETNPTFVFDEGQDIWNATTPGSGNSFIANNANGYIALGPQNTTYAHITTDRSRFYFNRDLVIGENAISSYNGDFAIRRNQDSQDQITVKEHAMSFTSDNNEVMSIDGTNKKVGINATTPEKDLHIKNLNEATILLQKSEAGEHYPRATVQSAVTVQVADIAGALSANATSMTIDGSGASSFASSGRAEIRATQDTFTYTGKTDNGDGTFTLTGIPSSGDNAIAAVDDNAIVINHPETFTIDGGSGQSSMPTSGTYYIHRTGDSFTADYSFNSSSGIGTFTNVVGLRESLVDGDIVDSDSPTTAVIGFMGNDQSGGGGRIGSSISHVARSAFGDYRLDFGAGSYLQKDPYYQANEFNYSVETEPRMSILDNGLVGIGTTAPVVYSSGATTLQIHDATYPELRLTNDTTGTASGNGSLIQVASNDLYIWNAENADIYFATNSDVHMKLDENGNLGIGGTFVSQNVNGMLHVRDENDGSDQYSGIRFFPADSETSATDTDSYHNITGFRKSGLMLSGGGSGNYTRTYATLNNDGFKVFTNAGDNTAVNMSTQQRLLIPTGGGATTFYTNLLLESTATSGEAPILELYKNDSGPAVGEATGTIKFTGENDQDQKVTYAEIQSYIEDETDATENAALQFWLMEMGTPRENLRLASNQITFNNTERNVDVLMKSDDGSHNFFSDAGNNRVGIGTNSPDYTLDVAGNIGVDQYIYHNGDGDTYINMAADDFRIVVGNDLAFHYDESGSSVMHLSYNGEADVKIGNGDFFFGGSQGSYDGNFGIGTTAPSYPIHINHDATNPATDNDFAIFIDHDSSGSGATGADREQGAIYVDVDSSTTGGDQSNEHRLYGIWSDTRISSAGDADAVYAVYGYAEAQRSSSPTTATSNIAGGYFVAASDETTANATISAIYGSLGYVSLQDTGTVSNAHGARGQTIVSGNRATDLPKIRGTSSEVDIGNTRTGGDITITDARVYEGIFDHNVDTGAGDAAVVTNAYMWYGNYSVTQADQIGTAWGMYQTGEDKNYFSAPLGINDTTPSGDLDIIGGGGGNGDINLSRTSGATINIQAQSATGIIGTTSNHNFQIKTNGSVRATVSTAGRLGIGDTSPDAMLDVESNDGSVPTGLFYRNDSSTSASLLKLVEDSVYADNPTLEVITDRTDGAIPSISVVGGAVTASGPNGWGTWEKETFFKHSYGTATGQGSGLINRTHDGVGTINNFTLPYDAKLRAFVVSYSFSGSTSSTADQTWRLFHSGDPANVVSDFTFDVNNDMTNMHGNFYVYVATGLDIQMNKNKSYSVRRESGSLNIQNQVRVDVYFTRHTTNY